MAVAKTASTTLRMTILVSRCFGSPKNRLHETKRRVVPFSTAPAEEAVAALCCTVLHCAAESAVVQVQHRRPAQSRACQTIECCS